jgi:hypothetical protein
LVRCETVRIRLLPILRLIMGYRTGLIVSCWVFSYYQLYLFCLKNTSLILRITLADSAVTSAKIPSGAVTFDKTAGIWWEEIGRVTLSSAGDTLNTGTVPAKRYLRVLCSLFNSGSITPVVTFNSDAGANYAERYNFSGTFGSSLNVNNIGNISNGGAVPVFFTIDMHNQASIPKHGTVHGSYGNNAAGTAPDFIDFWFKWVNTSNQITSIQVVNTSTGDFAIGSELVVLGHN